ncbi:MAG: YhjD/YihY/BrkB family envelope integrity protein [Planctomycetota bacterium]
MLQKLLSAPKEVGKMGAFLFFQLKLWRYCVGLLKKNHCGQQAAALSYHTIFGFVPLTIVMLLVFHSLPASEEAEQRLRGFVYKHTLLGKIEYPVQDPNYPEGKIKLSQKIDQITNRFFQRIDEEKTPLTLITGILVIWAAIALLTTVERTFNRIWHVTRGRGIIQRIVYYWATLTLAPLLLGVGFYINARYALTYSLAGSLKTGFFFNPRHVLPLFVSVLAFCLLYILMPNTKVNIKPAIWGALIAALAWAVAKRLFGIYVTKFIPYSRIYGIMGLVPLSVLWIYITWLIILFGLQLAYTTQHLKTLDAAEMEAAKKPQDYFIANDLTVINIMRFIAEAFNKNKGPVSLDQICERLKLPQSLAVKILDHLTGRELLVRTSQPVEGFFPAAPPGSVKLSDISEAVADASFFAVSPDEQSNLAKIAASQQKLLGEYSLEQILNMQA